MFETDYEEDIFIAKLTLAFFIVMFLIASCLKIVEQKQEIKELRNEIIELQNADN